MPIEIDIPFRDASEEELGKEIALIISVVRGLEQHGWTPEIRAADRADTWQWSYAEKSMKTLKLLADNVLLHISALDHAPPQGGEFPASGDGF
ncbi:hypothetical protein [Chthonobacter rhizosphaerae]|uniref:hypothetical protein n=1 Tax=Chthonobacter rhizosphaerae TaxID=2735553 RepID=UPI0015EEA6B6|nr:hypothetical protein [Chthonobacter rhizosphaerae]